MEGVKKKRGGVTLGQMTILDYGPPTHLV